MLGDRFPFATFVPAVLVAVRAGGAGPGAFAVLLAQLLDRALERGVVAARERCVLQQHAVVGGLPDGAQVVVAGTHVLVDGQQVRPLGKAP